MLYKNCKASPKPTARTDAIKKQNNLIDNKICVKSFNWDKVDVKFVSHKRKMVLYVDVDKLCAKIMQKDS